MNHKNAKKFLAALGIHKSEDRGGWIIAPCPLAPWRHSSGKDSRPSFGLKIQDNRSFYNCFSCNDGGNLETLLAEILAHTHGDPPESMDLATAYALLDEEAQAGYITQKDWTMHRKLDPNYMEAWPEHFLDKFPSANKIPLAKDYLQSRNVLGADITKFDIRFDYSFKTVVFPIRDVAKRLVGMRGRYLVTEVGKPKFYDYSYQKKNSTSLVWYNENNSTPLKPVILVEGALDAIAVSKVYSNVVAALTAQMSIQKIGRLKRYPVVFCMFDNDNAGQIAYEKVKLQLGKHVSVRRVSYPDNFKAKDPSELPVSVLSDVLIHHKLVLN